jgi:hypothetical protein
MDMDTHSPGCGQAKASLQCNLTKSTPESIAGADRASVAKHHWAGTPARAELLRACSAIEPVVRPSLAILLDARAPHDYCCAHVPLRSLVWVGGWVGGWSLFLFCCRCVWVRVAGLSSRCDGSAAKACHRRPPARAAKRPKRQTSCATAGPACNTSSSCCSCCCCCCCCCCCSCCRCSCCCWCCRQHDHCRGTERHAGHFMSHHLHRQFGGKFQ